MIWGHPMNQLDTTQAAVSPRHDDEDDILDGWLASLGTAEFARILNHLADADTGVLTAAG